MAVDAEPTDTHLDAGDDVIVTERPDQGLRGPGRTGPGGREPRPRGPPRRDLRPARPERRRQDDDRRHAHDPGHPDRRATRSSAASTSSPHPHRAKQVIGVVPQTNTLDRSLDVVGEPLLPRPLLRDERARRRRREADRAARAVPARRPRAAPRRRALGRHGAAADGGAGDHAPPDDPLPRRADRRASTRRAASRCGRSSASCTARARRSCSPRTTWRRPTSSATASRSSTTAALLALDTPDRAQAVDRCRHRGAPVTCDGDLDDAGAGARRDDARTSTTAASSTAPSCAYLRAQRRRRCREIITRAERNGFPVTDVSRQARPTLETVFINLTGKDLRE